MAQKAADGARSMEGVDFVYLKKASETDTRRLQTGKEKVRFAPKFTWMNLM
jgi:hypothetical protein